MTENDTVSVTKQTYTKEDSLKWAREDSINKILLARNLGSDNVRDTTERLKFKIITAAEFSVFEKSYHNPIDTSIQRILHSKEGFTIKTADSTYYYKYDLNDFCEYNCYVKPLDLYMIYSGNGRNEIACMSAIDSLNNKHYYLEHPFDNGIMETRVSPGLKYIIWFNNDVYESYEYSSFISMFSINREGASYKYADALGYKGEWFIDKLVWITDNSFALKVYKSKGPGNKLADIKYLKASF